MPKALQKIKCGENRFVGVTNVLEFFMTSDCTIVVEPIDSIKTSLRMDWTLDQFYAAGGPTNFVDRLAASLGIHASTIKVVRVWTGSVNIDFLVMNPTNDKEV